MRLLMFDNEFPPLGGGTGIVNYHLLQEMSKREDLWVDLITSSRSKSKYETERFEARITVYKVPVDNKCIHHSTYRELIRYGWRGLLLGGRLLRKGTYDLGFAFAGVPAGVMSYALKAATGLPYLVSLQGPDVPGHEARHKHLYPVLRPLLRNVWLNAGAVTAISQDHQRRAQETTPGLTMPIIHNGVDTNRFHPAEEPRAGPDVALLCVGRLIELKGQQHVLRAVAELRAHCSVPIHLTLVGTGDAEDALRVLARDLGLSDLVTFSGFVPFETIPAVYRQADVFALASDNEGMSLGLLEAMASGLPVVATNVGGTAELVQEGVNGFVVPRSDVPALAAALEALIEDEPMRKRMGQHSRQIAERFTWSAMTQAYLELCQQVASGRHFGKSASRR
jgi:glycosyltransferase involved in cell wall biosynthesis